MKGVSHSEITAKLRYCARHFSCDGCPGECYVSSKEPRTAFVSNEAADAIEELLKINAELDNSGRVLMAAFARLKEKVPKWISVEERLPEQGERVLVSNGGFICESYLSQSGKWQRGGVDMFFMTPTHWMPLLKPPKEVE